MCLSWALALTTYLSNVVVTTPYRLDLHGPETAASWPLQTPEAYPGALALLRTC